MTEPVGLWTDEAPLNRGWYWVMCYAKSNIIPDTMEPQWCEAGAYTGRRRWSEKIKHPAWPTIGIEGPSQ